MAYRGYSPSNGFLVTTDGTGDFTSLNSAVAAASSGVTVYLHGTVTENVTLKAGVNIASWGGVGYTPNATIIGKCSYTGTGNISISGIRLQTNSDYALSLTGANVASVFLNNCFVNATNNTAINLSNSNCALFANYSFLQQAAGQAIFNVSATAGFDLQSCRTAASDATASAISGGYVQFFNCINGCTVNASSAGFVEYHNTDNLMFTNATCLATSGTGVSKIINSEILSGTSSAVSIGAGTTVIVCNCNLDSSNANVLTGAGTLKYALISFSGSSSGHNVTTETALPTLL